MEDQDVTGQPSETVREVESIQPSDVGEMPAGIVNDAPAEMPSAPAAE